jgi:hypothetical protein
MKKIVRLIGMCCFMICMCSMSCYGNTSPSKKVKSKVKLEFIKPDSKAKSLLGDSLINVFFHSSKVVCYELILKDDIEDNDLIVYDHFVRKTVKGVVVDNRYLAVLQQQLLTDSLNYLYKSNVKAPFIPSLDFEFSYKKERYDILISFSNESWMITKNSKAIHYNAYTDRRFIIRYCLPFITNKEQVKNLLIFLKNETDK